MDFTYYIFALYVFLLACGVIWFYGRVMRADKKKDKEGYEKEQRLFRMYQNIEDMLGGFEEYAEEAKAAIEESLKRAEALMGRAGEGAENRPGREHTPSPPIYEIVKVNAAQKNPVNISEKPKRKIDELIPQYTAKGMDKEEIAKALGISSREVSMIMDLKNMK